MSSFRTCPDFRFDIPDCIYCIYGDFPFHSPGVGFRLQLVSEEAQAVFRVSQL